MNAAVLAPADMRQLCQSGLARLSPLAWRLRLSLGTLALYTFAVLPDSRLQIAPPTAAYLLPLQMPMQQQSRTLENDFTIHFFSLVKHWNALRCSSVISCRLNNDKWRLRQENEKGLLSLCIYWAEWLLSL